MGKRGRGRPRSGRAAGGNPHGRPGKSAGPIGLTAVEEVRASTSWFIRAASKRWSQTSRRAWSSGRPVIPRRRRRPSLHAPGLPREPLGARRAGPDRSRRVQGSDPRPRAFWIRRRVGAQGLASEFLGPPTAGSTGQRTVLRRRRRPRPMLCAQSMPREAESLTAFARGLQEA